MSATELTSGICDFETTWVVSTYTSRNELRGPAKHFGEYKSEIEARQALADAGFTDGKWGWRKGYSDAEISKRIKYSNPRADLSPAAPKVKALVWVELARGLFGATTPFGCYHVWEGHYQAPCDKMGQPALDPRSEAQADYGARILAALEGGDA